MEGSQLRPRGGLLSLRFGEPMEEVNYIDQVRLLAIDHPVGTEVYPNERFLNQLLLLPEARLSVRLRVLWLERGMTKAAT